MKSGYTKLVVTAAIAVLVLAVGSPMASAQSCPSSPNYLPDFTASQNCLTLNGINYNTPSVAVPGFLSSSPNSASGSHECAAAYSKSAGMGGIGLV